MKCFEDALSLLDDITLVAKEQEKFLPVKASSQTTDGDAFVVFHLKMLRQKIEAIQQMAQKGAH
jgi:hypothetical protein